MTLGLLFAVAMGLVGGGLASRAVRRLPMEKSLLWPLVEHCGSCCRPLPLWARAPLLGPILRMGACPRCRARLGHRDLLVEFLVLSAWVGLFLLDVAPTGSWVFPRSPWSYLPEHRFALFFYHGVLLSFLVVASVIDLDWTIIPDSVTVPGMLIGVGLGTFWGVELHPVPAWPPPPFPSEAFSNSAWNEWLGPNRPIWLETVRSTLAPYWVDHWVAASGFLVSASGLVIAGGLVWLIRLICGWAFGREAMGFGDVTLMAMIGSFLGWQTAVLAFFLAPFSAIIFAALARRGENPYGPSISIATAFCVFNWRSMWEGCAVFFANDELPFLYLGGMLIIALTVVSLCVHWTKKLVVRLLRV